MIRKMDDKGLNTSVNRSEATSPRDAERTLIAPHFDAAAIEQARRAVPLSQIRPKRTWSTSLLITIAVVAGLFGGIIGGILPSIYLKRDARSPATSSQQREAGASTPVGSTERTVPTESASAEPKPSSSASEESVASIEDDEAGASEASTQGSDETGGRSSSKSSKETEAALRSALNDWVAATNARDIDKQMSFYNPTMNAFYLWRNASRADVRAEREHVFERASLIDIRASEPAISISPDGLTAIMRFHKRYRIEGGSSLARSGEVLQELRWRRSGGSWRITSERDLRVVR